MNTTLSDGIITIQLPADLYFSDEFSFCYVVQSQEYAVDGTLHLDEKVKLTGREITLEGSDQRGWITKATADLLFGFVTTNKKMVLTLSDGRSFNVRWNIKNGSPLIIKKLWETFPHTNTDNCYFIAKFTEYPVED